MKPGLGESYYLREVQKTSGSYAAITSVSNEEKEPTLLNNAGFAETAQSERAKSRAVAADLQ